jgi:hypothetical protein
VAEARGQFRKPGEVESLPLETVTKVSVKKTDWEDYVHVKVYRWPCT